MQLLVDFFPLLLFLGTYLYFDDIFIALQVLMVAMPFALIIKWRLTKKWDKMLLASTALLLVMGGISLISRNPIFLFWKPTVLYWVVAMVFLGSRFIGNKTVVERMFATVGKMKKRYWHSLNYVWVIFFIGSGFLNIYVAYNFSEDFWVKFKVFGFTAITFVFLVLQIIWLMKHIEPNEATEQETE